MRKVEKQLYHFSGHPVDYYFDGSLSALAEIVSREEAILIVDDKVARFHGDRLTGWRKIIVKGEEASKSLARVQEVMDKLIRMEADRKTVLVGIGGGVVTDLTGFVASIYMRGISCGFVPTTLLAQVDAAVGGKNGVNYGRYKNILGIIRQPEFLVFDYSVLHTLNEVDYHSGFAEIIKYACIRDEDFLTYLERHKDAALARDHDTLDYLVRRSVAIKSEVVQEDEFESGLRRILNFGHTIGHAVEKTEAIPHGHAIAKGMLIAAQFSHLITGFSEDKITRLENLLKAYGLPTTIESDPAVIEELFRMDKKREKDFIHFILLEDFGKYNISPVALDRLSALLPQFIKN